MPSHVSVATAWLRVPQNPPHADRVADVVRVDGAEGWVSFEERDGDGGVFAHASSLEDLEVRR